jgi:hypothetical protein
MRSTHRHLFALVPLLAISALAAEDVHVSDLRLELGIMPNNFDADSSIRVTNSSGTLISSSSSSDQENADSNWRGAIQAMFGNLGDSGGFLIGGEIAVNHATFSRGGGNDFTQTSPVADLMLGYGFAPSKPWHFEITPFGGIGVTYGNYQNNNQVDLNYDQVYTEYGIRGASYLTFDSGWQLGVDLRYVVAQTNPEFDYTTTGNNTVSEDQDQENHGFSGLVGIGRRF